MSRPGKPTRREAAHYTNVAGSTVAGTAGAGFGAAKLRDEYAHQYPRKFEARSAALARSPRVPPQVARIAHSGRPGFRTLAAASIAGGIAAGAHRYGEHLDHRARKSSVAKFAGGSRKDRVTLKERAHATRTPPAVVRKPVESTAVASIGYQRPTRRLAVEMTTRRGEPYVYRVKPKVAAKVIHAESKGKAYNAEIRHRAPRATRYTVADRARLAHDPRSTRKPV
jgi:hypothetical protein